MILGQEKLEQEKQFMLHLCHDKIFDFRHQKIVMIVEIICGTVQFSDRT